MKRFYHIVNFLTRYLKDNDIYTAENKKIIKAIIDKMESSSCFDGTTVSSLQQMVFSLRGMYKTMFDVLIHYNNTHKHAVQKIIYLELYKFLKAENAYDEFMSIIKEKRPKISNLRQFMLKTRPNIFPDSVILYSLFSLRMVVKIKWKEIDLKWNYYIMSYLNEKI